MIENITKIDMRITLTNGSQIKLLGSDAIDRIVGTNPIGIVFTEFSLHRPEAWGYLRPILAENGGWAIFNGTPRGLNHFYDLYQRALKDTGWHVNYLTRDDTNIPALDAIEEDRRSGMSESLVSQEYYCSWSSSQEETLIPLDIIQPCVDSPLIATEYDFAAKVMGCDVAYAAKGDKASIAKRQGRLLDNVETFQGLDNMAFAARVAREINEWKPDACFVDYGRGEGVIHRLWQMGYEDVVIPVHFSGKPYSELYLNKRAEIWCRLRDWFLDQNKPSIPNDEKLIADLSAPTFFINDKGYIQLESKLAMKRRKIKSPDAGDAVALTFGEEMIETKPKTEDDMVMQQIAVMRQEKANTYDPMNYLNNMDGD